MWNDKRKKQGVLLYFSATGFRAWQNVGELQGFKDIDFFALIKYMVNCKARFTRIDVAIDVIDGSLSITSLHKQIQSHQIQFLDSIGRKLFKDHQKFFGVNKKITGITCGARSSDNFLRIYDKKIEQNRSNAPYSDLAKSCKSWMRIEGEFKHDSAHAVLNDLKDKKKEDINHKLIGYVVKRWMLADTKGKLIPLWNKLTELANGEGTIPPLDPQLTDRLIQELKWFLVGGAAGVFYRVAQLFGKVGKVNFFLYLFEYVKSPDQKGHFSIPSNLDKDLELIRKQHPNLKTVDYYLNRAVKEIEKEKEANQAGQDND